MSENITDVGQGGPGSSSRRRFIATSLALPLVLNDFSAPASAQSFTPPPMPDADKMHATKFMVAMRDGVKLATDIYLPEGKGSFPIVLVRTPYSRRIPYMFAPFYFLVQAGFGLAVQDCRGRFESEGVYRPFVDDMEDGYDSVEWLAAQSFSTGKIGMTGASAMGITAYMAAMAQAPHLAAAAVTVARNPNETLSRYPGGLFLENGVNGWAKVVGVEGHPQTVPNIAAYTADDLRCDIRQYYNKIKVPFLHGGGWFDIHQQPLLDNFIHFQNDSAAPARGHQKLVMAPSCHLGPVKGAVFPNTTATDLLPPDLVVRWFNRWLKGEENGITSEPAVRYYLMGDTTEPAAPGNKWVEGASWPPKARETSFYLRPDGGLSSQPSTAEAKASYVYDPNNAVPSVGGNNLSMDSGPLDQRQVSHRDDVLRFVTEPLSAPTEVVGRLAAELWVSTDAQDTDFIVKLLDIHPDGTEALVHDEGLRLRHYKGLYSQTRITPGQVYPIKIDLWSTALVFNKGHRIGICVQSSNWPRFQRHTNTWDPVPSYAEAVKATNTVYFGPSHRSRIILPITRVYPA
jgi:predicted acyl esterase